MYAAGKCCDCTHNIKVIALTFRTPLYERCHLFCGLLIDRSYLKLTLPSDGERGGEVYFS